MAGVPGKREEAAEGAARCLRERAKGLALRQRPRAGPGPVPAVFQPLGNKEQAAAPFHVSALEAAAAAAKEGKAPSEHQPEIILNNFTTRLGHSIGRMFASLFPHDPQFVGRQVATFHNQCDYIFFRFHRYIFKNEKRVVIQELGSRFTLKLKSLQKGTFDSKFGEYEWIHKRREMDTSRRKFHL